MKKANKILMASVAILLSLVLITTSVVSGVFAKFAIKKNTTTTMKLEKFGVTMEVIAPDDAIKVNDGENVSVTLPNVTIHPNFPANSIVQFKFSGTTNVITNLKVAIDVELSDKFFVPTSAFPDYSTQAGKAHMPIQLAGASFYDGAKKADYKYSTNWVSETGTDVQAAIDNLEKAVEQSFAAELYSVLSPKYYIAEVDPTYQDPLVAGLQEGNGYYARKTFAVGQPILFQLGGDALSFGYRWGSSNQSGYKQEFAAYIADSFTANDVPIKMTITVSLEQAS